MGPDPEADLGPAKDIELYCEGLESFEEWKQKRTLNFTVKAQRALKNGSRSVTGVMGMVWRDWDWKQGDQFKGYVSIQRRNDEA